MLVPWLITVIFILFSLLAGAQNLIPNGGFEKYSSLPDDYGQANRAKYWTNVNLNYEGPPYGSPDYYHTSGTMEDYFGQILPHKGSGQMGFATYKTDNINFREYISTAFSIPLEAGKHYEVSFYLSNGKGGEYTFRSNNIGFHFSVHPLYQSEAEPVDAEPYWEIPTIVSHYDEWQKYSFNITPTEDVHVMTIGNFRDDENTEISPNGINGAYYFIDHIFVRPTNYNLQVIGNKDLCYGESTTLYAVGDFDYRWAISTDPTTIISTDSIMVVKPLITTTYIVYGNNDTTSITISVSDPIPLDLGPDRLLCQGEKLKLDIATWGATYLWQDSSTKSKYTIRSDGIYWVDVTVDGCTVRDSIIIVYQALPVVELGHDMIMCPGDIITLDAYIPGADYLWQNESNSSNTEVTQPGQYWVEVTLNGCSNRDTVNIYFDDESCYCELFVPNAFSPNGDGLNDLLLAKPKCPVDKYSFNVYNRWGSKVFESDQPGEGWNGYFNGRLSPVGVYIYQASFNYRGSDKPKVQKGSVTLIR